MFRKLAAIIAVAAAALFVGAGSASAYTPTTAQGTTSASTVTAGGSVVFSYSGGGYAPGTDITIAVSYGQSGGVVGSTTADANGNFSTRVTLSQAGTATLIASGAARDGGTLNVTAQVRVLAAGAAAGGSGLPRTGSELGTQLWIAGGLLAAGGSLVLLSVARRRQGARA
ncbi:MAG TPA: hypothetical protein VFL94_17010 [Actinomycetales bacterium]|nr:hypothetical protein [Actinomycetales bacterium]